MYLTSLVTTRIGIELAAVQMKLPDCVVVGLQLYSARTFLIYPGGQDYMESPSRAQSESYYNTIE